METGNYKNLDFVNLPIPVDNQSITFNIPPNISDYNLNLGTRLPNHRYYYRYISDVTYRVDTSGIYNITTVQTIQYGVDEVIITPGFYDINALNTILTDVINPITLTGPNAFKAIPKVDITSITPEIQRILNWPSTLAAGFVPEFPVDITVGKDLMLVYLSFVRQSAENNQTDVVAIPISPGTGQLGFVVNGNFHSKTPVLESIDTISSATIRLRTVDNQPYLINTPVFINVKLLFSLKNI